MNLAQPENIYKVNGLNDFKLKNTDDLLRVHGINYKALKGYDGIDDLNKDIYEKFIIKFFNSWGLQSRDSLMPTGIYLVDDIEYVARNTPDQDYCVVVGELIQSVDRYGIKTVLKEWINDDYKYLERIVEIPKRYLRFEYQNGFNDEGEPRNEWLHIIKEGKDWY